MFSISSMKRVRDALLLLAVGLFGFAQADGPVSVTNLPGGGGSVTSDTDITEGGGLGQRWGRAGGRTITYHVNNPAAMSALRFSVTQGSTPSTAFDGSVTNNTGENMTFNSMPAANQARWTGSATLPLAVPPFSVTLATRFTMTVTTSGGSPIPLAVGPDGVYPAASVLSTGDFKVNLLFEMQDLDLSQTFHPTLDYYDAQATPAGALPNTNTGPVMTGVSTGFYYALAAPAGMTLEEHDAHLTSLFGGITPKIDNMNGKINFINTDWPLRWNAISADIFDAKTSINNNLNGPNGVLPMLSQIQQQVAQLAGQGGSNGNLATKNDIQQITQTVMTLWGLMPCPLSPAECAQIKFIKDLSTQASVDAVKADTSAILIGLNQPPSWLPAVQNQLNFLATHADVVGVTTQLNGLTTDLNGILIGLNQPTWLAGLQSSIGSRASQSSVDGILIGLNNAIQGAGFATQSSVNALDTKLNTLSSKIDALDSALDAVGSSSLNMIIGPVDAQGKTMRFVVTISRDGQLVNATLSRLALIRSSKSSTSVKEALASAKVTALSTGVYDVKLDSVKNVTDNAIAFIFEAQLVSGGNTLHGNALVVSGNKGDD